LGWLPLSQLILTRFPFSQEIHGNVLARLAVADGLSRLDIAYAAANRSRKVDAQGDNLLVDGVEVTAKDVAAGFAKMSSEAVRLLGFTPGGTPRTRYRKYHPKELVISRLPISPTCVRPPVFRNGEEVQSDATVFLAKIIQMNRARVDADIPRFRQLVSRYIKRGSAVVYGFDKRASVLETFDGKPGLIRSNLMGKRVNACARTVITPDATLDIDEVGVPSEIAEVLTIPERVNRFNLERLQRVADTSPSGKKVVLSESGKTAFVGASFPKRILSIGDIMFRSLRDGDAVVMNRQPTLHKMSIMGHRVRIMPGSTFRLSLAVTGPYNADFDGDEMNMHVPQTLEAVAEVRSIMSVVRNIVSPQASQPVIGLKQDALLGMMELSKRADLSRAEMSSLLMSFASHWNGVVPYPDRFGPPPTWSFRTLWSVVLSCCTTQDRFGPFSVGDDAPLTKKELGATRGGFIHKMFHMEGPEVAAKLVNIVQVLGVHYLTFHRGFSVGMDDCRIADGAGIEEIRAAQRASFQVVADVTAQALLDAEGSASERLDDLERGVRHHLDLGRTVAERTVQGSLGEANSLKLMTDAGSKGTMTNIMAIHGMLGQQLVCGGKRVTASLMPGGGPEQLFGRSTPHFRPDSGEPIARGMVAASYSGGLDPLEYYFHSQTGREGNIDTAIGTPVSGYISRSIVKALEDIKVNYGGTVGDTAGRVFQFQYGSDGFDAAYLRWVKIPPWMLDEAEVAARHPGSESAMSACRSLKGLGADSLQLPMDPCEAVDRWTLGGDGGAADTGALLARAERLLSNPHHSSPSLDRTERTPIVNMMALAMLPGAKVGDGLLDDIERAMATCCISSGEAVGAVAAVSIGEPTTQITLNTFHTSGIANVTPGSKRIKELLSASEEIKGARMTIPLREEVDRDASLELCIGVRQCILGDVVKRVGIIREPIPRLKCREELADWSYVPDPDAARETRMEIVWGWERYEKLLSKRDVHDFVLVLEIDPAKLAWYGVDKSSLRRRVEEAWESAHGRSKIDADIWVEVVHIGVRDPVVRVRAATKGGEDLSDRDVLKKYHVMESKLCAMRISGVPNVLKSEAFRAAGGGGWTVETAGSNLRAIFQQEGVDFARVMTNDVQDALRTLGVEAARSLLVDEVLKVLDNKVCRRHVELLADWMTFNGCIAPVSRTGLARMHRTHLSASTFENQSTNLMEGGLLSQTASAKDVSVAIMTGADVEFGTGKGFGILMDLSCAEEEVEYDPCVACDSDDDMEGPERDQGAMIAPTSPVYEPRPPGWWRNRVFADPRSMTSPAYSPTSPAYNPSSPVYNPTSPAYNPSSPVYNPTSPAYNPSSPVYNPTSPAYHPTSPVYNPVDPYGMDVDDEAPFNMLSEGDQEYDPESPEF
jgi:DNA-directed RNA polymerase II subunit RPB1